MTARDARPKPLPQPTTTRWQPLRLGLVELFRYDSEEFWFHEGRLLLRGNNGTGKSKVLSLTLPFLFDANLRPARIEPDGDAGKRMNWNLLVDAYERRIGYAWIEFGRRSADGTAHYLTLGAGLSAVAARQAVESWFFILDDAPDAPRIGADFWLLDEHRSVLTRERLRAAVGERGQVFEKAEAYRRAVDERLFHLGKRYGALMDTLIQLRQPQLSKKPDETALSNALSEALPPLEHALLGDVAEALNHLEEERRQLEEFRLLAKAVRAFDERYRVYASMLTRRQARELRQAQTAFDNASAERNRANEKREAASKNETAAEAAHGAAESKLLRARATYEELLADPTMNDANRLAEAKRTAANCRKVADAAGSAHAVAEQRLQHEVGATSSATADAVEVRDQLCAAQRKGHEHAGAAGLDAAWAAHPLVALAPRDVVALTQQALAAAEQDLNTAIAQRRHDVVAVRNRHDACERARDELFRRQNELYDRRSALEEALERRSVADSAVDAACDRLVERWATFAAGLRELAIDAGAATAALVAWTRDPTGDNPALLALRAASHSTAARHAAADARLATLADASTVERHALVVEHERLAKGDDTAPPPSATRDVDARLDAPGAPLWKLIDFDDAVGDDERAALEAALEATGLLDAWVTPDGALLRADGPSPWFDRQLTARAEAGANSLASRLRAAVPHDCAVPAAAVESLLAGIAYANADPVGVEAWISPQGRYRIGPLAGAWHKPAAAYIGYAARERARVARLAAIDVRLREIADESAETERQRQQLGADRAVAEQEWNAAPGDGDLHTSRLEASDAARAFNEAQGRHERAAGHCREAEALLHAARFALERDASDLRLPIDVAALLPVERSLDALRNEQSALAIAASQWRRLIPMLEQQKEREQEAVENLRACTEALADARANAEEAAARHEALREAVGEKVESLQLQLATARDAASAAETAQKAAAETLRNASAEYGRADAGATAAEQLLERSVQDRATAIARLQQFAATSLLASALPGLGLPALDVNWTIDAALTLARRAEHLLSAVKDDDASWKRLQNQISEDFNELQRALATLGHRASAESSDWGMVVHVVYANRPERPDRLIETLALEIDQRSHILTEQEREILENYLQADIAAEIQRLLQTADRHVDAINRELDKRPTSTGVRYRLQWHALSESDGAPVGFERARERLLNKSSDLWTVDDKRAVGTMLQQRIAAERERADADVSGDAGNLIDQLARALDYRRWHRFRVQRLQDGQWRKLSGPASSGERALGLTVPLFAAIASFYGQGSYPLAPRLMLLDEAFAGIDDAARAHCMALIREFDLDFVITSEREWACYAELPGVSICQLQKLPDVDAIYVSRWTWDGRARRRETDPERRFPAI